MNKSGPIIVIEDDQDDQELFEFIFEKLGYENEVIFFYDGLKALDYLIESSAKPFLIISDINLPKLDGLALKEKVHNNEQLRLRCIPYLFFTTSAAQKTIIDAYSQSVQGFFVKPSDLNHLEHTLKVIIEYWKECMSPNYTEISL